MIENACATQAILSVLLNCEHDDMKLGETLQNFKLFVNNFDPDTKGLALSNSDVIREVHNSFARYVMIVDNGFKEKFYIYKFCYKTANVRI